MIDLFKKEIATFFCSAMGYLVVSVFLVATWLLIWVIPSEYNVIYGGYATLSPLFDIAPWIYLFLVPAISMRLIAEERRQGTLELLLIRPQPAWRIVVAKYAAGLTLVLASIAPTLVYVSVVCSLGAPQGNIDMGGTIGSYLALILLAATYMSAGVFASSITSNQIVAFIVGAALCAFIYVGFDMVAALSPQSDWGAALMWLGLAEHYSSVSRGVLDVQDGVYFMSVCAIFISVTSLTLSRDRGRWRSFASVTGVAVIACVASSFFHFRLDLTSEKRYTLSDVSIGYADSLSHPVSVKLYLDGELNPGFRRLRRQTIELCRELSYASSKGVRVATEDPSEMEKGESREFALELSKNGLSGIPVFETKEDGQKTRTVVYPFAKVSIGDNSTWINLLENVQGLSGEESLNRSIEGIEYKLTDAIARLSRPSTPKIAFLEGHGELDEYDVLDATDELAKYFEVDRGQIGSDASILNPYKVLIIAKPTKPFPEKDKYAIDQYVMRGGRVLWLLDAVDITLDSLRNSSQTVGLPLDLNLDDMLFVYGIRMRPTVIEDMNCGMVPISVPSSDGQSRIVPMPWLWGPLMATNTRNPVSRNVNFIHGDFTSPIDTVGEGLGLIRTPLLRTSAHSRVSSAPVVAELSSMHRKQNPADFPIPHLTTAILEEGKFQSVFSHRRVPDNISGAHRAAESETEDSKMIFVGDGDIIRNAVRFKNTDNPTVVPLGYDDITRQTYGNKAFIVNAVQYLADDKGLMALRNRTFTLRLLDRQKISDGTTAYKVAALCAPLAMIAIFGLSIALFRRHKFANSKN